MGAAAATAAGITASPAKGRFCHCTGMGTIEIFTLQVCVRSRRRGPTVRVQMAVERVRAAGKTAQLVSRRRPFLQSAQRQFAVTGAMIFHLSTLAIVLLVVWAFHRYQLVSDHLVPFLRRRGLLGQYTRLPTSFDDQASAGVRSRPVTSPRWAPCPAGLTLWTSLALIFHSNLSYRIPDSAGRSP